MAFQRILRLSTLCAAAAGLALAPGCRAVQSPTADTRYGESQADESAAPRREVLADRPSRVAPATDSLADGPPESAIIRASAVQAEAAAAEQRFQVPAELPGANADPLRLPPFDATQSHADRRSAIEALFPELPEPVIAPGPFSTLDAAPLNLAQLQSTALQHSPGLRVAAAEVHAARGLAVQAGLYKNPTIGYEGDSLGTARTAGYNGVMMTQEFITAGKLGLAQSAALMKVRAAEQNLRRQRIALASDVRRGYFAVLIAQERIRFARAIAHLSEEVYQGQIDLVAAGEAAAYEPLQLRVFAVQARNEIVRAENDLAGAWRGLAATLGLAEMSYHPLVGTAEMPPPQVSYQEAAATLLARHSDLGSARALISSACFNVQLQQALPIPNITVYSALQHDDTSTLNDFAANVQVGLPLPLFDRNQGNICAARAELGRAQQQLAEQRNQLLGDLADAYNRYSTGCTIVENYRRDLLPDLVRVYRGVYERFRQAGGAVDFAQIVVSQQALADGVTAYLDALRDQWGATVDLAELMQVDDFFGMDNLCPPTAEPTPMSAAAGATEPARIDTADRGALAPVGLPSDER